MSQNEWYIIMHYLTTAHIHTCPSLNAAGTSSTKAWGSAFPSQPVEQMTQNIISFLSKLYFWVDLYVCAQITYSLETDSSGDGV